VPVPAILNFAIPQYRGRRIECIALLSTFRTNVVDFSILADSPVRISELRGHDLNRSPYVLSLSLQRSYLHRPLWLPTMKR
jgi:hypothetical protein